MSRSLKFKYVVVTGIVIVALSVFAGTPAAFGSDAATRVAVRADKLHIESSRKMATFEGHVRFSVEAISIECDRMTVQYDKSGALETAQIEGNVLILQDGAEARASRATLNMKTGIVMLYGNPQFTRLKNTLSGKRMRINIRTGEVDVFEATGTFVFKQENNP